MDLEKQVALITGAARGIGKASAKLLAEHGAHVIIADLNEPSARQTARELETAGLSAEGALMDVSDPESIRTVVADIVARHKQIDILVNNAGIVNFKTAGETTVDEWDRVLDINLRGVHLCSQAVIEQMIARRKGKIVNLASMGGQVGGLKVGPDYTASKAGVVGLAKSYARYGAAHNVNVNAVAPGFIATDMTTGKFNPEEVPLKRIGTAEDVAKAVYFLASPLSDYITGATIDVNGGVLMR
jgi:NAD(P)-dependent dehydrogenase (short-subunit alcohol dehydrogenase family)